jgi:hypothetical protein
MFCSFLANKIAEVISLEPRPGSALIWVTASQKIASTFSLNRPTTSTFGTPASSRRTTLASGVAASDKSVWERRGRQREEIDGEVCLKSSL